MSAETSTSSTDKAADRATKKALRKVQNVNIEQLESRVLIAELRAREVEAEVRYMVASQTRRQMRAGKRDKPKAERAPKPGKESRRRADMAD